MGEILVSVLCLAYNHQASIAQALDGMLMQQRNFEIEILIHDDASVDQTAEIIRDYQKRYPDIVKPVFQNINQYYKCNLIKEYLKPLARGKYIAICEGDDYWTDPHKLKKQVALMEGDPALSMCFHAVEQLDSNGDRKAIFPRKKSGIVPAETIITKGGMFCPSPSLLFRRDVLDTWPEFRDLTRIFDYPTQVMAACMGKVFYLNEVMAVYRFESEGSWTLEHASGPDWEHWENKKLWMSAFDRYTEGAYHQAILSHYAWYGMSQHLRYLDGDTARVARDCINQLTGRERLKYKTLYALTQIGGRSAVRAIKGLKDRLKAWGLY